MQSRVSAHTSAYSLDLLVLGVRLLESFVIGSVLAFGSFRRGAFDRRGPVFPLHQAYFDPRGSCIP